MSRFEKTLLWLSAAATAATGSAYAWMKYFAVSDDPFAVANHPWQPWMLKAHIVAAPFLVFAIGMASAGHVGRHWRSGRPDGRRSGLGALAISAPMVVSGYLIQAVTHPGALWWIVATHLVTGFAYCAALAAHRSSRTLRSRQRSAAANQPAAELTGRAESGS